MEPLICNKTKYDILDISEETGILGSTTIKLDLPPITDTEFPSVSIVVPTYNRPEFYELIIRNFERIDYPREKLELIVIDDTDREYKKYHNDYKRLGDNMHCYYLRKKMSIGGKRNALCWLAKNEYIVHMDDDDWYTPESVACRIRILLNFEKKYEKLGCFGCDKVLCLDLITGRMFESFDKSTDGTPATISESTMAYSKKYWELQKWDDRSVMTECLPFIRNRHNTVCTGPSVFVVTQFTHLNNTVERRIVKDTVSEYNYKRFQNNMSVFDEAIFNNLRARIIANIPSYRDSLVFIKKFYNEESVNKIRREYNKLSIELKKNPLLIDFIQERFRSKNETSGKDIVYYCGPGSCLNFSSEWNPTTHLGGSEEAVVNLSKNLVKLGYNITVYCCLEGKSKVYEGVSYKPYYEWIPCDKQDITIIWRDPSNTKKKINSKKILLDVHDVLNKTWLDIDPNVIVMSKSNFHKKILDIKNSVCVIPNGIDFLNNEKPKKKNLLICTSSSDRCIIGLLNAIPLIRKEIPDTEIHWAYGFSSGISKGGMETNPLSKDWVKNIKEHIKNTEGFVDLGRLGKEDINELYEKADLFVYPTYFPEIDCISLTKAISAGCIPIVTSSGAMTEKMGLMGGIEKMSNSTIDYSLSEGPFFDNFVKRIINTLKSEDRVRDKYDISNYSWENVSRKWDFILSL